MPKYQSTKVQSDRVRLEKKLEANSRQFSLNLNAKEISMNQDVIVFVIVGLTIGWIIFKIVRSLVSPKKQGGCGGCTGCNLS